MIKIAPSMLSSDFSKMGDDASRMELCGADWLHLDIMDGQFVPPITFGSDIVAALGPRCGLVFDVHLMVENPERQIDRFINAGANIITVHAESCAHMQRVLRLIKDMGAEAGVALNPATPLSALDWVMDDIDLLLIMTVNPGYGGQKLVPQTIEKVRQAREKIARSGRAIDLQVDGGVNAQTAPQLIKAGANVLVTGSYLFSAADPEAAVKALKGAANA